MSSGLSKSKAETTKKSLSLHGGLEKKNHCAYPATKKQEQQQKKPFKIQISSVENERPSTS